MKYWDQDIRIVNTLSISALVDRYVPGNLGLGKATRNSSMVNLSQKLHVCMYGVLVIIMTIRVNN